MQWILESTAKDHIFSKGHYNSSTTSLLWTLEWKIIFSNKKLYGPSSPVVRTVCKAEPQTMLCQSPGVQQGPNGTLFWTKQHFESQNFYWPQVKDIKFQKQISLIWLAPNMNEILCRQSYWKSKLHNHIRKNLWDRAGLGSRLQRKKGPVNNMKSVVMLTSLLILKIRKIKTPQSY